MAEYIEREEMLEDLRLQFCKGCNSYSEIKCRSCSVDDVIGFIEDVPTADVVPVVRCKDCKHFQPAFVQTNDGERRPYTEEEKQSGFGLVSAEKGINCGSRCERFGYWEQNSIPVWFSETDYCSYGERRCFDG